DPAVEAGRQTMLAGIPLAKLGKMQDIADTVYFVACEATYLTGQTIKVDGGRSLR
ncbi:MAG TPA: pteridine reductase, partial [Gammaproteobacteria bacterium]|nr:pteridine reductase [Gammaproteobacteria bacterium]